MYTQRIFNRRCWLQRFCLFIFVWQAGTSLIGQPAFNEEDPFAGGYRLAPSDEIVLAVGNGNTGELTVRIIDANGTVEDGFVVTDTVVLDNFRAWVPMDPNYPGMGMMDPGEQPGFIDLVVEDFNGDGFDEIAVLYEGMDREVMLALLIVNPETMLVEASGNFKMSEMGLPLLNQEESDWRLYWRQLQLCPIQADDDNEVELAVAWWAEGSFILMAVMEIDESGMPALLGFIEGPVLPRYSGTTFKSFNAHFAICPGQFLSADLRDGTGETPSIAEELMLVFPEQNSAYFIEPDTDPDPADPMAYHWQLTDLVYRRLWEEVGGQLSLRFDDTTALHQPIAKVNRHTADIDRNRRGVSLIGVCCKSYDFDGDGMDEAAVLYNTRHEGYPKDSYDVSGYVYPHYYTGLCFLDVFMGNLVVVRPEDSSLLDQKIPSDLSLKSSMQIGDLDQDGSSEIAILSHNALHWFQTSWSFTADNPPFPLVDLANRQTKAISTQEKPQGTENLLITDLDMNAESLNQPGEEYVLKHELVSLRYAGEYGNDATLHLDLNVNGSGAIGTFIHDWPPLMEPRMSRFVIASLAGGDLDGDSLLLQ